MTSPTCQTCAFYVHLDKTSPRWRCTRGEPPWLYKVPNSQACQHYAAHVCHQCAYWCEWTGDCLKVGHDFANMDGDTPACPEFQERED